MWDQTQAGELRRLEEKEPEGAKVGEWESRGLDGPRVAALDQPQLAEAARDGGAGETKVATMVPQPLCIQPHRDTRAKEAWDLQGAGRSKAERH